MTQFPDSTVKFHGAPSPNPIGSRLGPSSVQPSVYIAWALFAISLLLPTILGIPGYQFVAGTALGVAQLCMGEIDKLYVSLLFIPNIAMLLSPLALSAATRRGLRMTLLVTVGIIGALVAIVATCFSILLSGGSCGGLKSGGDAVGVGFFLWALSSMVLAVGLSRTKSAERLPK